MADLLGNVGCGGRNGVTYPSPPSTSSQFAVSSFAPPRRPLTSPQVANEFAKLTALIPQAVMQAQDQSSATSVQGIKWWERDLGVTIADVCSAQELMEIIRNAVGKLVIVEFFASWCGSCRALYPKLCKLAKEHKDIVIVKVNFDENKAFCKNMDVKVLPYFHLYRGNLDKIDAFSCSILKLQKLKDAIAKYKDGEHTAEKQGHLPALQQTLAKKIQSEQGAV